jgi:glutaconate CoA-transferase subunit A
MRACKEVIISCEELVTREAIGRDPNRTVLPGYKVVAVVPAPFGAHPKNCQGFYDVDRQFIFDYIGASKTTEGWKKFMDEWVYGVDDWSAYLDKYVQTYGMQRFLGLKARDISSSSVNYGF